MPLRRMALALPVLMLALRAPAQTANGAFVGAWIGEVPGIGDARLIITAVRQDGQVEGRMEFTSQAARPSYDFVFGDKADPRTGMNYGVVSGSTLSIETALGGTYSLDLSGDQLSGAYSRGTTYRVAVRFTRF